MNTELFLPSLAGRLKSALGLLLLVGAMASAQGAATVPPSELLEQGIYSEETKGDLDAAMRLYQQVVDEAKSTRALAAQAQYRLGVCYYKKKDFAGAAAAFEKLSQDFPDQKEIVARATEYLANATPLLPVPWEDGEESTLDVRSRE